MIELRVVRRGPTFAPLALLVAAFVLSSSVAAAAPAVVTATESEAHSAPFKSTPVLHTFHIADKVSAEEQAKDGWRRVRLPDGRMAFVRDDELKMEGASSQPAPPSFPTTPAHVKVFELTARSGPAAAAPVLTTFPEGAALAVSEDEKDGFRRVVLPDGRVAFVAVAGLTMGTLAADAAAASPGASPAAPAAAPGAPIQPLPSARPEPLAQPQGKAPIIYVKDLGHLAEMVKDDPVVFPMADSLADRRNTGLAVMWGGMGVGTLLAILALTTFTTKNCIDSVIPGDPPYCTNDPNLKLSLVGVSILGVAGLAGLVIMPSRNDILDVLNTWNRRHTDNQFTIESREVGSGH
jgi:hypothetical protein